jgi:hypothetical protein
MSKARDLANAGTALGAVTATELGYVDGVTSAIQTQIDGKQAINANVSTTELGYLDGVTSSIQTQIGAQIPKSTVTAKGDLIVGTASGTVVAQAVGANGTVLTADSAQADGVTWATPSSGGMTLLSTTTLSGASTTISSINQTYNTLYGVIYGVTNATTEGNFEIRPNNSATLTSRVAASSNEVWSTTENTTWFLNPDTAAWRPNRTSANNVWTFEIGNYTSTSNWKTVRMSGGFERSGGTNKAPWFLMGSINTTSAISSLVFLNGGGNLSTGTVLLYGVK